MNNEKLPISLCVTVFNEGSNLSEFFGSIERQHFSRIEVVFCDGGSTDDTVSKLKEYSLTTRHSVRVIESVEKINIAKGRNIAIASSKGAIIAVTDAGCKLDELWLQNITLPLIEDPNIDVVGGYYYPIIKNSFQRDLAYVILDSPTAFTSLNFTPSSRSICFRKSAWLKVDGYPEHLRLSAEDTLFDILLKKAGCVFWFEPSAFVWWSMREDLRSARSIHYSMGYGEGEAGIYGYRYLFYLVCSVFPILLFLKRRKFRCCWLQYILMLEMLKGWIAAKKQKMMVYF